MDSRFDLTPGTLRGLQFYSSTLRIFEVVGIWCGGPGGKIKHVELANTETAQITKKTFEEFKQYLEDGRLKQLK